MPASQAQQAVKAVVAGLVACSITKATTERFQGRFDQRRPDKAAKEKQTQSSDAGPGWY